MSAPSDLDVYRRLVEAADEFEALAAGASLIGETALKTAATTVRGMANAVYEHALNEGTTH
jgi:hypothetical protein